MMKFRRVILLQFISFLLGVGDYAMGVVGRRVDGVHRQAFIGRGIDDIVDCASSDDHDITIADNDLIIFSDNLAFAGFKSEKLIDMIVNFLADILKWF